MKRTFLLAVTVLAVLLAASCQKEDIGRVLTATIEQYEHNDNSKAYINADNYACWEAGDLVSINGTRCSIRFEEGTQGAANTAIIEGCAIPTDQDLLAYYPADCINNDTVTLPQVQTYEEHNGHQIINNPMAAYCPANSNTLRFRNLCALLKVTLHAPTTHDLSVKNILVKGDADQMLWGRAPLTLNNQHQPMLNKMANGNAEVCLSFGDHPAEISAGSSKSFYIVVPAGSDFFDLSIAVTTDENDSYLKVSKPDQTLPRNHIGALAYTPSDADTVSAIFYRGSIAGFHQNAFGNAKVIFNENSVLLFDRDLSTIGDHAFKNCEKLTSITLPATLTSIGQFAFYRCESLSNINWPDRLTSIGRYAFENCKSLTTIDLSHTVIDSIATHAFFDCQSLTTITLPASLRSIGKYAFEECYRLTGIDLPENLISIGEKAFCYCTSLTTVNVNRWSIFPIITQGGKNMFLGCNESLLIYVPPFEGVVDEYQTAEFWSDYADIIRAR